MDIDHLLKQAQIDKIKAEEEKIRYEHELLKSSSKKRWYYKEKISNNLVAAILAIPVLWVFFGKYANPVMEIQKINGELEISKTKLQAYKLERQLDSSKKRLFEVNQTTARYQDSLVIYQRMTQAYQTKVLRAQDSLNVVSSQLETSKAEKAKLDRAIQNKTARIWEQRDSIASLETENQQLRKSEFERQQLIASMMAAQLETENKNQGEIKGKESSSTHEQFSANKGKLRLPVDSGRVIVPYGLQIHPVTGYTMVNKGVDLVVLSGISVKSVFAGVVSEVFTVPGLGQNIIIRHNGGYSTVYANLMKTDVAKGDLIQAAQQLGLAGPGRLGGLPQVHFEVWKGSEPQNPMEWLRF
ncbi:MAG: peptidoglycan DD-metalloendopeptidase family protein [Flavobacteriales bacterium]|nr:peptidoglycan DD-metalloendopeptidase family protein [Flavobacteriales bacterium]MCB9447983.1 peptidoglycan DD-metalloendopeptidase family protein [Flavobacteriales bacterium]